LSRADGAATEPQLSGHLFVLVAAVLWGTTGTAQAFAPDGAGPLSVGAVRIAVGGLALLAFAVVRGDLGSLEGWPPVATATAGAAMAAYQPLFFAGVSVTGVAAGTIVAIGSAPAWAGLIGFLFLGERSTPRWALATTTAILGCVLLVGAGGGVTVDPLGVLLALGAGASYAAFATAAKRLLAEKPHTAVMAVAFSLGALLLSPVLFFADSSWILEPCGAPVALELGLLATATAYLLFGRGLTSVPVTTAATLSLAEPLTAGLLGVLVFGERLGSVALLGVGLLVGGLVLASSSRRD
jgi:DME family drug/metabolite transporter